MIPGLRQDRQIRTGDQLDVVLQFGSRKPGRTARLFRDHDAGGRRTVSNQDQSRVA